MLDLTITESLTPIIFQLAIGGIGGFFIGYILKRIFKVALILIVIVFSLLFLAYTNIIDVDYVELSELASNFVTAIDPALDMLTPLLANVPFITSFIVGFFFGLSRD
jgi:uncharacterized membrane protein (Fun14 family)